MNSHKTNVEILLAERAKKEEEKFNHYNKQLNEKRQAEIFELQLHSILNSDIVGKVVSGIVQTEATTNILNLRLISHLWKSRVDENIRKTKFLVEYFGVLGKDSASDKYKPERSDVEASDFSNPILMAVKFKNLINTSITDMGGNRVFDNKRSAKELNQYDLIFLDDNVKLFENVYIKKFPSNRALELGFDSACKTGAVNIIKYLLNLEPKEKNNNEIDNTWIWLYNRAVNEPISPPWTGILHYNQKEVLDILLPNSKESFIRKINPPHINLGTSYSDSTYVYWGAAKNQFIVESLLEAYNLIPTEGLIKGVICAELTEEEKLEKIQYYIKKYNIQIGFDTLKRILLNKSLLIISWLFNQYKFLCLENASKIEELYRPEMRKCWHIPDDVYEYVTNQLSNNNCNPTTILQDKNPYNFSSSLINNSVFSISILSNSEEDKNPLKKSESKIGPK